MATVTSVSVSFKKTVSDGNYGSEVAEVTLTADLDASEDQHMTIAALLDDARLKVNYELLQSPSNNVRRALQAPPAASTTARPSPADDEAPF